MAVLEKLHRKVVDMGLVPKIISSLARISLVTTLLSFAWLTLFLPMEGQYRRTYISENALMPSQAYSYFRESEWNILRGYRNEVDAMREMTADERNRIVATWMEEYGAKAAVYKDERYGETLYAVLHATRGDGTEAMVLAAPWENMEGQYNTGGVALAIAMGRYFSRWPVWSKNIIIVLSEDPRASLRAWVQAYHTKLDLTGGSIEAAVVLDYPGTNDYFQYVEINYEGLNGGMPNLDMVNVAVHITEHEGMKVALHGAQWGELEADTYFSRMRLLLKGVKDMALAGIKRTSGNEAFSGWRIQSVTLKARGTDGGFDITTFGRVPEAMFRSVNNLLEKFHQSFFFYLLLAPRYFVSIGSYLPAAVGLSISFAVMACDSVLNNEFATLPLLSIYNIWAVLAFLVALLVSAITAQVFFYLPAPALLLAFNVAVSFMSFALVKYRIQKPFSHRFKAVAYLYLSTVLSSLLVTNFQLAFTVGLLAFPMTLVRTTVHASLRQKLKNSLLLLLSNPFISIWIFVHLFEPQLNGFSVFYSVIDAWNDLGCWTWYVLCLGWYPAWIMVAYSSIDSVPVAAPTKKSS
ncbi:AaceriAGR087Cp [[Ashbya] aceris (nom. inval.)]|nr:AaceriAGR087Cp [[Ashbya] aceris (nom. inval.)]